MNKYLMMSAAALVASGMATNPASASGTRIGFSGYCDGYSLSGGGGGVLYLTRHLYTGCGFSAPGSPYFGGAGKNKKFGELAGFRKFLIARSESTGYLGYGYAFQLPIKTGNAWIGFAGTSGGAVSEFGAGTYYTGYSHTKGGKAYLKPSNWSVEGCVTKTTPKSSAAGDAQANGRSMRTALQQTDGGGSMNKYLMMTASALLASTAVHTSASARTTRIGFSGFCDGYQFSTKDGVLYVARHLYTGCGVTSASPLEVTAAQRNRSSSYKKFLVTGPAGSSYLVFGYVFQLPIKTAINGPVSPRQTALPYGSTTLAPITRDMRRRGAKKDTSRPLVGPPTKEPKRAGRSTHRTGNRR